MYSVSNLPMKTLIAPDEVIAFFPGDSISPNLFSSVVYEAEQRFAIPLLGRKYYQQLCAQKSVMVTASNITYLQQFFNARKITLTVGTLVNSINLLTVTAEARLLWNNVLWPLIAKCVYYAAMPNNYAHFTTAGIVKNNPVASVLGDKSTESVGISLSDMKYIRDSVLLDSINLMTESVKQYVRENRALYPHIPVECYEVKNANRRTGIMFIYDDDDCGCDSRASRRGKDYHCDNQPGTAAGQKEPNYMTCTLKAKIATDPNPDATFMLCNMDSIPAEYPVGDTLTIPMLINGYVNDIMTLNGNTVNIPFDPATGTFDNTSGGGFNDGDLFIIMYNQIML